MTACAAALNSTQADAYLLAQEQYDSIITRLRAQQAQRMTHSELEQFLDHEGRELLRRMFQAHLDERGPGSVSEPVVDAQGREHTHQRLHSRSLKTIFPASYLKSSNERFPFRVIRLALTAAMLSP